ncbi:cellobiose ABC transporter membrane protein [Saccharothrix texasensis]|uniref:Cellobiose ABC transporter membrane protein n=2 Tax=Saccharothrix texasensis TaxID=103734 RepID=A0A3N1HHB7_9PSEU|nr:cellobiose ABC transporter membrane protein [Saccharothrix texasensis]
MRTTHEPATGSRAAAPAPERWHPRGGSRRRSTAGGMDLRVSPYLYIAPFFVLFFLFGLAPMFYTAWVALHEWHPIGGQGDFVGLANFTAVLGQGMFWKSVFNTLSIFVFTAVPQLIAAIFIAAVLDANLRAGTFWRMAVLLPYVAAPVAVAIIFSNLFGNQFGLVNNLLATVGLPQVQWTGSSTASHVAISTMVSFRWTGYNALILLAGMQAIPRDLYEAAGIDGASRLRRFFSVTIPMLRPTLIFVIITTTIGNLQIFDEARIFGGASGNGPVGGADGQWKTITLYLWEVGWRQANLGRSAAIALLLLLLIVLIGLINFLAARKIASDTGAKR